jgi:hypothetical protein
MVRNCNVKCLHGKYYIINLFYYKSFQILSLQGEKRWVRRGKEKGTKDRKEGEKKGK